jgi:hypothetical protein
VLLVGPEKDRSVFAKHHLGEEVIFFYEGKHKLNP